MDTESSEHPEETTEVSTPVQDEEETALDEETDVQLYGGVASTYDPNMDMDGIPATYDPGSSTEGNILPTTLDPSADTEDVGIPVTQEIPPTYDPNSDIVDTNLGDTQNLESTFDPGVGELGVASEIQNTYDPNQDLLGSTYNPQDDVNMTYDPNKSLNATYDPNADIQNTYDPNTDIQTVTEDEKLTYDPNMAGVLNVEEDQQFLETQEILPTHNEAEDTPRSPPLETMQSSESPMDETPASPTFDSSNVISPRSDSPNPLADPDAPVSPNAASIAELAHSHTPGSPNPPASPDAPASLIATSPDPDTEMRASTKSDLDTNVQDGENPPQAADNSISSPQSPNQSVQPRSVSPARSTQSGSKSPARSMRSDPASPARSTRSGSASPARSTRSGSASPARSARSRSASPARSTRSGSASPARSARSRSASPARSTRSGSASPARSARSGSASSARSARSGSASPARSARSGSASPARSTKSGSASPKRVSRGNVYADSPRSRNSSASSRNSSPAMSRKSGSFRSRSGSRSASPAGSRGAASDSEAEIGVTKKRRRIASGSDSEEETPKPVTTEDAEKGSGDEEGEKKGDLIADIFGGSSDEESEFEGFDENDVKKTKELDAAPAVLPDMSDSDEGVVDEGEGRIGIGNDFDAMLAAKKAERGKVRRRKKKDGDTINDSDDKIAEIVSHMKIAAEEDRDLNQRKQPAVKKLRLLEPVMNQLKKADMHDAFLDGGILSAITEWLAPLPDKSLPALRIRENLLQVLATFPLINSDSLKTSGVGKAVMYLYKHPKEVKPNRLRAGKLINEWSRPIFNLKTNFQDLKKEDRERRDIDNLPKRRRISNDGGQTPRQELAEPITDDGKARKPGDKGFVMRARVPRPSTRDYAVRPRWNVEELPSKKSEKRELNRYERTAKAIKDKKSKSKLSRAVTISIEGRNMQL